MDFFAHGFWSYIIFHKIKKPIYAVMFGLLPDIVSWGLYLIISLITRGFRLGPPLIETIPSWVFELYGLGHSVIVAGIVILAVSLILKKFPVYMLAWPVAIVMDMITHTREFLPTPFLWPVSDWKFPGFSWASLRFMVLNYLLIIGFLVYICIKKRKNKKIWTLKRKK